MSDTLPRQRLLAIIEMQNELAGSALDIDAVMEMVVRRARELVGAAAGVIELVDGADLVYHVAGGTAQDFLGLRLRAASSLSGRCVAQDEVLYCEDAEHDDRVDAEAAKRVGAVSMVCVPLRHEGGVAGVLKVYDPRPHAFDEADVKTLSLLSGVIAARMANASDYQEQHFASRHDELTGLPNRRAFDEQLGAEASRLRRHGGEVALCLVDLDHFKAVNDTLGHPAGDAVLRAVARHFDELRGEDAAYRIGGDEFALLLVGAGEEGARLVMDRIAAAVAGDSACHGVTLSRGIATVGTDPAAAFAAADASLYAVKAGGRV